MRTKIAVSLVVVLLAALALPVTAAQAQGGGELVFGEWVEGTLTASEYEHTYTFEGKAGSIMMIAMLVKPGTYDLDPAILLRDSTGAVLVEADDTVGLSAVAVMEMPADGEYSILATRSGGATGNSEGAYVLRVNVVDLLVPGSSAEATVYSNSELDIPNLFVFRPEEAVTWGISFSQPESELHAQFELQTMPEGDTVFELGDTTGLRSGTLNVDLEAGMLYVLSVQQSFFTFVFEDTTIPVTITVSEAE